MGYNVLEIRTDITYIDYAGHARRKFEAALYNDKARAGTAMEMFQPP